MRAAYDDACHALTRDGELQLASEAVMVVAHVGA